jgi:hypothetical protein
MDAGKRSFSSRLVVALATLMALVVLWGGGEGPGGVVVHAAAPAATSEVSQTPAAGSSVAPGTPVSFTATVTLSAGQPQALTIQLSGDSNIINRTLTCTSSSNGNADTVGWGGAPSCMWLGPVVAGTFTFVFAGTMSGSIGDAVPDPSSVVCTDTNSTNTCGDELPGDKVALADANGDVGPVSAGAAPAATSEVNQVPAAGSTVAIGARVTYTATITLATGQAQALAIQLKDEPNLGSRTVTCTSGTNGSADAVSTTGSPFCKWDGPVVAGTFTFVFAGDVTAAIGDAVPDAASVVCSDTAAPNGCAGEASGVKVALADANNDVGPLALRPPPAVTSEVNQTPPAGSTVIYGTHVGYTATVTLSAPQAQALTIQLRGDNNIVNRTLTCTSSSNGIADSIGSGGAPSCMWLGPVAAGTFTFVFGGTMSGSIADAVPDASSVVCTDTNSTNTCDEEASSDKVALADATGDVGLVSMPLSNLVFLAMVARD